jgi:hypothetical protein
MSSIRCELPGFFTDIPVLVRVNNLCLQSRVSSSFLHNVPRSVGVHKGMGIESTSGLACVPIVDGWYHSCQPFRLAYLCGCDVGLGRDWLASHVLKSSSRSWLYDLWLFTTPLISSAAADGRADCL